MPTGSTGPIGVSVFGPIGPVDHRMISSAD
jgi:hypothetical protein